MRCASAEVSIQVADRAVVRGVIPSLERLAALIYGAWYRGTGRVPSKQSGPPQTCSGVSTSRRGNWRRHERGLRSWNDFWPKLVSSLGAGNQAEGPPQAGCPRRADGHEGQADDPQDLADGQAAQVAGLLHGLGRQSPDRASWSFAGSSAKRSRPTPNSGP